jgi:outer membrane receptor protein involved in Fe transport
MKPHHYASTPSARLVLFAGALIAQLLLSPAQVAPQPAPTVAGRASAPGETIQLSLFEVNTSRDTSYGALNSTSISAFNLQLLKTPVAADIFTEEFMRDVAITNVEDLLNGYGAGVGQVLATPGGDSNNNQSGDWNDRSALGSRGVAGSMTRRNGFVASGTSSTVTDTFDIERVEMIKGASALLFGASGAGGFVNTGSKLARFGSDARPLTAASITSRIDQYGSKRWQLDANYGVKDLAYRFVLMDEDTSFRRLYLGAKTRAVYGAIAANLPFNTTLRLTGRWTDVARITNTTTLPTRKTRASTTRATPLSSTPSASTTPSTRRSAKTG